MERRKSEELTDVLQRFMRASGLETPLNQHRLIEAWPEVAGQLAAEQTRNLYIRNQTLYVQVSSPALRANLMMDRARLTSLLNNHVKANVITDVVVM